MPPTQIKTSNIADGNVTDAKIAAGVAATKLADGTVSNAAFQRIAGLTSDAQSQINAKQASSTELTALAGMVTTGVVKRTGANTFSASTVGDSDIATGVAATKLADGSVSNAAFQRIAGLTSDAQAQLDAKVADVVAGDAIDISGSGTKTVSLSPGLTAPLLPMLWNGQKWENRSAGHDRIIGGHADEHHRYVDREVSVTDRNVIQPQADIVALDIRELSDTQTSVLQTWSDPTGSVYNSMDRDGLTVFNSVTFIYSGVVFNGIVSGSLPISSGTIWIGNGSNLAAEHALSGDATMSNTGVVTIANNAVSLAKMATMATASLLGRNTAGTGNPEVLSASTAKSLLSLNNVENTALSTWAGTTNITTLGTISSGTWSGTTIGLSKGGTNANLSATGGSGQVLRQSSSGAAITVGTLAHSEVTGLTTGDPHTQYPYSAPASTSRNLIQPAQDIETALILRAATTSTPGLGTTTFWGIQNSSSVLQFGVINTDCVPTAIQTILPVEFRNRTICKFFEATGNGTNFVGFRAPSSLATDYTYDWPVNYGTSGYFMQTNGAGTLSWVALVAGDIPNLAASKITSGQMALARGGTNADLSATGGTGFVLKQTSSGATITSAALLAADIPSLAASIITSGQLALARGGTNADLSATGGTSQVLKQTSAGAAVTVGQLDISDISGVGGTNAQSQITSNQNDYTLGTSSTQALFTVSADANGRKITGLAGGAAGRVIRILNTGTKDIILTHEDSSSTAANRMTMPFELDMVLRPGDLWTLVYDTVSGRWIVSDGYVGYLNDPAFCTFMKDDFCVGTNGDGTYGELGWCQNNSGGSITHITTDTSNFGVGQISSGTNSSGRGEIIFYPSLNTNLPTGMVFEAMVKYPVAAAAGVTDYTSIVGWKANLADTGGSTFKNNLAFCYNRTESANWVCATADGSTANRQTSSAGGSAVAVAANAYQRLKIVFNAAGNKARFYVDDVFVAESTSNFPPAGNAYSIAFGIWNSADGSHTAMKINIDYMMLKVLRTTRRS